MKDAFSSEFEETLARMKWPGKDIVLSGKLEHAWTTGAERLLDLQEPYVTFHPYLQVRSCCNVKPYNLVVCVSYSKFPFLLAR